MRKMKPVMAKTRVARSRIEAAEGEAGAKIERSSLNRRPLSNTWELSISMTRGGKPRPSPSDRHFVASRPPEPRCRQSSGPPPGEQPSTPDGFRKQLVSQVFREIKYSGEKNE